MSYLIYVFFKGWKADVIDNIASSYQQRVAIFSQQFEIVCVGVISKEPLDHVTCKERNKIL